MAISCSTHDDPHQFWLAETGKRSSGRNGGLSILVQLGCHILVGFRCSQIAAFLILCSCADDLAFFRGSWLATPYTSDPCLLLFGARGVMIQLGTGMMDVLPCIGFSMRSNYYFCAAPECAFGKARYLASFVLGARSWILGFKILVHSFRRNHRASEVLMRVLFKRSLVKLGARYTGASFFPLFLFGLHVYRLIIIQRPFYPVFPPATELNCDSKRFDKGLPRLFNPKGLNVSSTNCLWPKPLTYVRFFSSSFVEHR